jgi:Tol biopolymer transport system component
LIKNRIFYFSIGISIVFLSSCGLSEKAQDDAMGVLPAVYAEGNIAFTRSVTGGTDIFMYGLPTDDGLNVTNLGSGKNEMPAISPDNTKIAFVSQRDGNREIYVMNLDGSNVTRLTNHAKWDIHPTWSHDGTRLAFVSNRDGVNNIYTMSALNGSDVVRVTKNDRPDNSPSWSPDGKEIVFSSELGSSLESPVPRLYRVKADGTGLTLISKTTKEHEIEPCWSSQNLIAYCRSSDTDGAQIYTMKPDGTAVTKLTSGPGGWHPDFCDAGSSIAFVSDRTSTVRVFTMFSDGTKVQQLLIKANMEFEPSWGTSLRARK